MKVWRGSLLETSGARPNVKADAWEAAAVTGGQEPDMPQNSAVNTPDMRTLFNVIGEGNCVGIYCIFLRL